MSGSFDGLLKWSCAVAYGLLGVLMGAVFAFVVVKVLLLAFGTGLLSAKAAQVIVLAVATIAGFAFAAGYLRNR